MTLDTLLLVAAVALSAAGLWLLAGPALARMLARRRLDPYAATMAGFDRRLAEARAAHRPIRAIEAERRAWLNEQLRGAGGASTWGRSR